MKLRNRGFAISTMLYSILLLFLMLVVGVLAMLGNRKMILDKINAEIMTDLNQKKSLGFSFDYKDILLANTSKVSGFTFDLLDGVKVRNQNGNIVDTEITTTSSPTFDSTKNGVYTITYEAIYEGITIKEERTIEVIDPIVYTYSYTGKEQEFITPSRGLYQTELWGAQGGTISGTAYNSGGAVRSNQLSYVGGKGAYTKGNILLEKNSNLYIYVGGTPIENTTLVDQVGTDIGGYNGGVSLDSGQHVYGAAGGGATDIRLERGVWNDFNGLKSRLMVAAGGGGANFRNQGYGEGNGGQGGTINGINGYEALVEGSYFRADYTDGYRIGLGATQISGGASEIHFLNGKITTLEVNGTFGGLNAGTSQSGGGGGYYSGGSSVHGGAGGGSSFISGYDGCDAIDEKSTANNIIRTGQSIHYSGYEFNNTVMKAGNEVMPTHDGTGTMTGNEGNGYAKITALIVENGKVATNLVKNGGFEETSGWNLSNASITRSVSKSGGFSLQFQPGVTAMSNQVISAPIASHIYYGSVQFLSSNDFTVGDSRFEMYQNDIANGLIVFAHKSNQTTDWMKLSSSGKLETPNSGDWVIRNFLVYANTTAYTDDVFIIDLTEIYGAGNEPTKEWCDANIHYFDGIGIVPKY